MSQLDATKPTPAQIDAVAAIVFQISSCSQRGAKRWALQILQAASAAGAAPAPALQPAKANGHGVAISREEIRELFREAAVTLGRLKCTARDRPMDLRAAWPDVVRATWDAYEPDGDENPNVQATQAQIASLDRVLPWLLFLEPDRRALIWARAQGVPWRKLERHFHVTERWLRERHKEALDLIRSRIKL